MATTSRLPYYFELGATIAMAAGTLLVLSVSIASNRKPLVELSPFELVTGEKLDEIDERSAWDVFHSRTDYVFGTEPTPLLKQNIEGLPRSGQALDLAMSEGQDSVYLARLGYTVEGVDFSEVALRKAKRLAKAHHVEIATINADLRNFEFSKDKYDVILNMRYFQRDLLPQIFQALKPGGVLVFRARTIEQLKNKTPVAYRRENLLELGEARELLKGYEFLVYEETNDGKDAFVGVVARKPSQHAPGN